MRLLFIHHGVILGGAPLSLLYLARELESQQNIEIIIASHSAEMRAFFKENLKSTVIDWEDPLTYLGKILIGYAILTSRMAFDQFRNSLWHLPGSIIRQIKLIRRIKPDVVHLNSSVLFTSAIAVKMVGIPIVWHIRECILGDGLRKQVYGWFIRRLANKIIAISDVEAKRLGSDQSKVQIIYNPLNFETLQPDCYDQEIEKKKLGLDVEDNLVLSLGGVNPRKGTYELVDAMRYVGEKTKLVIAGPSMPDSYAPDSYYAHIASVISQLLSKKVSFTGLVEEVAPLLAACDVLVFLGITPHFPRPVFEAWMMRKPVVVFEMDGISNNIEHNVDGVIVQEKTGKALGLALKELLDDNKMMAVMGEHGRVKAERLCNPVSHAAQVMKIYQELT